MKGALVILLFSASPVFAGCEDGSCSQNVQSSPAFQQAQAGFSNRTVGPSAVATKKSAPLGNVNTVTGQEAPGTKAFAKAPPQPSCASGKCSQKSSAKTAGAAAKAGKACASCGKGGMDIVRKIVKFLSFGLLG